MPRPSANRVTAAALRYRVESSQHNAHLFSVTLTLHSPLERQRVCLPVWIPGSYLVREFAKHLQSLAAHQGGRKLLVRQVDKCTWEIGCQSAEPLLLHYQVYAYDPSVRAAWLDSRRGFFNPTSLCLRVPEQEDAPHELELVAPPGLGWQVATSLPAQRVDGRGFGLYRAANYDELADSPVEMGRFWHGQFRVGGVNHRVVVAGALPTFDAARLLADMRKICEAALRFWPGPSPVRDYLFLINAVADGYGGLEHRASTALLVTRKDLPRVGVARADEGYTSLLGLISHEYFHTWCVKRLRPAEFARYDYQRENYTELLWFFEGFTSYYDDLLLRRAELVDNGGYLRLLAKSLNQTQQTPGRKVQSLAAASWDAWVKYYRPDENTLNATVSYYSKGALVALCLDLCLRAEGHTTLDQVMRALWQRCAAGPMQEADLAAVLAQLGQRSYAKELRAWVHGVSELPLAQLLKSHGVVAQPEAPSWAQRLGLRVTHDGNTVGIKTVMRGGLGERAGFAPGDEWLGVQVGPDSWRLSSLDDLDHYLGTARRASALVARDQRLLQLQLSLGPAQPTSWRLLLQNTEAVQRWLSTG